MGNPRRKTLVTVVASAALFALTISPAEAAPGDPDATFGRDGVTIVDLPGRDAATAIATTPDGRVLVAGSTDDGRSLAVLRLTSSGRPDPSFGSRGARTIRFGASAYPAGVAAGRDGSAIVATALHEPQSRAGDPVVDLAGNIALDAARLALVKLGPRGALDRRFGEGGVAFVKPVRGGPVFEGPVAMAVQRDGSIVVAAAQGVSLGWFGGAVESFLYRFTPSGHLDASFGVAGVAPLAPWAAFGYTPSDVFVQRDGRIVVGGVVWAGFSSDYIVQRYMPDGTIDASFATAGSARVDVGDGVIGWDTLSGVAPGRAGEIVVFGGSPNASAGWVPTIAMLDRTGRLKESFGTNGVVRLSGRTGMFSDAVVQADGAIVASAQVAKRRRFAADVLRITPDGSIDDSFARTGAPLSYAAGLALQPTRVVATGPSDSFSPNGFVVAAFER